MRAIAVRSRVNSVKLFTAARRPSPSLPITLPPSFAAVCGVSFILRTTAPYNRFGSVPEAASSRTAMLPPSRSSPSSRCSVPMQGLAKRIASATASSTALRARGVSPCDGALPESPRPTVCTVSSRSVSSLTPASVSARQATPPSSRSNPSSKCSQPT